MLGQLVDGGSAVGERVGRGVDPAATVVVSTDLPIAVVDKVVAVGTELRQIVDVGGTVVQPMLDVVGLAPL